MNDVVATDTGFACAVGYTFVVSQRVAFAPDSYTDRLWRALATATPRRQTLHMWS